MLKKNECSVHGRQAKGNWNIPSRTTILGFLIIIVWSYSPQRLFAHSTEHHHHAPREWFVNGREKVKADFLYNKGDEIYLQGPHEEVFHYPLQAFSFRDRHYLKDKITHIHALNLAEKTLDRQPKMPTQSFAYPGAFLLIAAIIFFFIVMHLKSRKRWPVVILFLCTVVAYSFRPAFLTSWVTNPQTMDSAFIPFKPNVVTSWDSTYFYIESFGIPATHGMMTGITNWQQQVPIPQCYIKPNAWMIPLQPVLATTPVPVNANHFIRGAIAVAVNGVPIFNPYTNTGVDAFLTGQLDQWGGHCGRADDYHYHIAPLQLYASTQATLPIAYALDGFAVYGAVEPDGTPMLALDSNNGHWGQNGTYHYHGVPAAPYMIGRMVGQVTEDATLQIVPQPHANPVRPALTPLNGAVITNCVPNGSNGYTLTYSLAGQSYQVNYNWTSSGLYTFNFINPSGTTSSTYNGFIPCVLPSSIHEVSEVQHGFSIYPNPSSGFFTIRLKGDVRAADVEGLQVLDARGSQVFTSMVYQESISLHAFNPGIYFILLQTKSGLWSEKIVLQPD